MIIPGIIIDLVTFPGVVLHESAHRLFCDLTKTKVYDVSYYRFGDPSGYVIHEEPKSLRDSFLISIGPLFINTFSCAILGIPFGLSLNILDSTSTPPIMCLLAWLGFSFGMHAFPSNQDVNSLINHIKISKVSIIYFLALSFVLLIKLSNFLRFFWFDLIYAIGVSVAIPYALIKIVISIS